MSSTSAAPFAARSAALAAVRLAALFAACLAAFYALLVQNPGFIVDIDALYHYRVASLIRTRGPWVDIDWLPYTVLGARGPDHQWLFHVLVAPLTALGDSFEAVMLACAATGALVATALYALLRAVRVPHAALFAVAAIIGADMLPERFIALRAQDIAVVLMFASLLAIARGRDVLLGFVAFAFTESYHAVVILAAILACTLASVWLFERRFSLRPVIAVGAGVLAGLVASPWFPDNVRYLVFHTFFKAAEGSPKLYGEEWFATPWAFVLRDAWRAHALLASGLAAAAWAWRRNRSWRPRPESLATVAMALACVFMYHFANRFAEYYVPFAVLAAALLWRDAWGAAPTPALPRAALAAMLVAVIGIGAARAIYVMNVWQATRFDAFAAMMQRVERDTPSGRPMVFNTSWSDFQRLVFWSSRSRYVAGLDGHYLLYGDLKRFQAWFAIVEGSRPAQGLARDIRETFGAEWVVVSEQHPWVAAALARDREAELVMSGEEGWLYRLRAPR